MCSLTPLIDQPCPSTVNASYRQPSETEILKPNEKIENIFKQNATNPWIMQRLTSNTYFFGGGFYTSVFYVGKSGVLLLDAPEHQGNHILEAIAKVTDLPVTAIVYSHNHADHILGAEEIIKAGAKDVRIITSAMTAEKIRDLNSQVPAVTEEVAWPKGSTRFEDLTLNFSGFTKAAHVDDAGVWLLVEEEVCYVPDLINPDQPPFWNFATAENYLYYRRNVVQVGSLDWVHFVGGHGNIGAKEDIRFYLEYLDDLEANVEKAMEASKFAGLPNMDNWNDHATLMELWRENLAKDAVDAMRPKYGKFYGFEKTCPSQVVLVTLAIVSYRKGIRALPSRV